jgi:acyl-CoA reductase-like NAD-dependent aldehyde dehydrogenase
MTEALEIAAHGVPRGRAMIERAEWASRAFARYDAATVRQIVAAVAEAGAARAREFAERAVAETGFGVVAHKEMKNLACSTGLVDHYSDDDYVSMRIDEATKIVEVPRPAGVVLALTPSTNPVATVMFKTLIALMTRNAIVISPHPFAREVCSEAARVLAEAATAAGAPDGAVQWVEEPSIPLINALMTDERTDVILATGGTAVVRAAYRSGNPALGVGPGNVPVLVDRSADLQQASQRIIESKAFDNSILCTNESVLVVEEVIADRLLQHMTHAGGYLLNEGECDQIRQLLFPNGEFDVGVVGKDASWLAEQAGIRVGPKTKVLLAPFDLPVPEEMLAHEKLTPVLGVLRTASASRGIDAACALLRIDGAGHSAAIHSTDPRTITEFAAAARVLRVVVNVGSSLGSAGIGTNLAPSMTIGTGFFGRSSVGENLQPKHLVNWTKIAYGADVQDRMADFSRLDPWHTPTQPTPAYPSASNAHPDASRVASHAPVLEPLTVESAELREEIRRLIVAELRAALRG